MAADQPDGGSKKKAGSGRTLNIILGVGGLAIALVISCVGCRRLDVLPWNGVGFSERGSIVELHTLNRQAGRENRLDLRPRGCADLTDHNGKQVRRQSRVKYHARGTPDRVLDQLYLFRDGNAKNELLNPFGDNWKTAAMGLDWQNPQKKIETAFAICPLKRSTESAIFPVCASVTVWWQPGKTNRGKLGT